jgi:hypothetical protein
VVIVRCPNPSEGRVSSASALLVLLRLHDNTVRGRGGEEEEEGR